MNTDVDFAVWCARQCLHLWNAPRKVKSWLTDPKPERAAEAAWTAAVWVEVSTGEGAQSNWAANAAADAAEAVRAVQAGRAVWAAKLAVMALDTTIGQLRLDYVATWSDNELALAEGEWIEAATVEILDRRAAPAWLTHQREDHE